MRLLVPLSGRFSASKLIPTLPRLGHYRPAMLPTDWSLGSLLHLDTRQLTKAFRSAVRHAHGLAIADVLSHLGALAIAAEGIGACQSARSTLHSLQRRIDNICLDAASIRFPITRDNASAYTVRPSAKFWANSVARARVTPPGASVEPQGCQSFSSQVACSSGLIRLPPAWDVHKRVDC